MKYQYKLICFTAAITLLAACKKVEDLPYYDNGRAVTLTASTGDVAPTPADSVSNVISFSWTNPDYASDTATFRYILEMDSTGRDFSQKSTRIIIGTRSTSFTGKELNAILLHYGFSLGTPYELDVRVISSYNNNNERYVSNVLKVSVTPYNDPSVLTASTTTVTPALATAANDAISFTWTPSFNGYAGAVNYVLQYDSAAKNFSSPQEFPVGTAIYSKTLTEGQVNTSALNEGVPGGSTGTVEYRLKATTAEGAVSYSNAIAVTINSYVPILRFYLPGGYQAATGNGDNWDPATAPEMIRDLRGPVFNKMYYAYIYLPANAEFKITQGRSWAINYGGSGGTLVPGGGNLTVASAGVYRVSINQETLEYDIRPGRMGFVGGATGAGWNPPNVFPAYAMGAPDDNLFVGLTDFSTDGWKMIDNDQWNNGSNAVDETRSYGSPNGSGSTMEVNGPNFPNITSAGRYRVIWDGRNPDDIKYEMSIATEMRLVGDGINEAGVGNWDPPTSPQMNYMGNGVWTITVTLHANKDIKFLAGNAWGAFDYEDNSGQSQAVGVERSIKWEGGDNFKTPAAAGTYTITLNEHTQKVIIN